MPLNCRALCPPAPLPPPPPGSLSLISGSLLGVGSRLENHMSTWLLYGVTKEGYSVGCALPKWHNLSKTKKTSGSSPKRRFAKNGFVFSLPSLWVHFVATAPCYFFSRTCRLDVSYNQSCLTLLRPKSGLNHIFAAFQVVWRLRDTPDLLALCGFI